MSGCTSARATSGLAVLDIQLAPEAPLPDGFSTAWLVTYGTAQPVHPAQHSAAPS